MIQNPYSYSMRGALGSASTHESVDMYVPVSREFGPHQRLHLFHWARNFTLIQWLLSTGWF